MHRVDTDGHVGNLFDEGDPAVPRLPTQVDKHILNAFQEELANAITATGLALVKGTNTQLRDAMGLGGAPTPGLADRFFSGKLTVDAASSAIVGTTSSAIATDAGVTGNSELATGVEGNTTDGVAGQFNVISGTGKAIEANGSIDLNGAVDINNLTTLSMANPLSGDAHTNQLSPLGLVKGWAHLSWSNAAPTLASGMNMAAPGNPAAGQIQINLTSGITSGAMVVVGNAGPGSWQVVPLNLTGLISIQDNAGAAVPFGSTTGFVFVQVMGRQ